MPLSFCCATCCRTCFRCNTRNRTIVGGRCGYHNRAGIQVSGYAGQPIAFELTITFPEGEVTGFGDATDIELIPTRLVNNNGDPTDQLVPNGATVGNITTTDNRVHDHNYCQE